MQSGAVHILVVDDHPPNRYLVTRILTMAGFSVEEAESGTEALAKAERRPPALVTLDIELPDMSGREVCRRLKQSPRTAAAAVLHLSGSFVQASDISAALDSGADGYLTLPIEPVELVSTVRALLRTRSAEEAAHAFARQWQKTFDAIADAVCLLDEDGYVQRCNRAFAQLVGRDFPDIIGASCAELLAPALGVAARVPRPRELAKREVVELEHDGRWLKVAADPVHDDESRLTGAVLIVSDVTTDKRTAEAIRRSNQELLHANRIKDEFLATLSHELRTPLNAMLGWTRLLRTGRLDADAQARALETIDRNAALQAKMVEDLLDVSRVITGKLRLRLGQVDMVSVIEAAIHSVRPAADAKAIRLSADLDSRVGLLVGDGDRLQQVMWNLLSNAIKFTPAGGHVTVRLRQQGALLGIEVEDDGSGISAAFLPYVFDRFRQADSSTTRAHGGLGLGLAIVRHLVELHGGVVEAASAGEGHGSTFAVKLPLRTRAEIERAVPREAAADATDVRADGEVSMVGLRVLVLDDDQDARELLAAAFAQLGAAAEAVATVDEALTAIARAGFDVVVSDIAMPIEDGYAFVRQLRAREGRGEAHLPAVAHTAYATAEDARRALSAGYDLHVAKPVDAQTLARVLVELVGARRAHLDEDTEPIALTPPAAPAIRSS